MKDRVEIHQVYRVTLISTHEATLEVQANNKDQAIRRARIEMSNPRIDCGETMVDEVVGIEGPLDNWTYPETMDREEVVRQITKHYLTQGPRKVNDE
jgi:hypothetical protein